MIASVSRGPHTFESHTHHSRSAVDTKYVRLLVLQLWVEIMSAPSFSSFPAFNTFPDLDPGPSTRTSTSKEDNLKEDDKKRHKKSKRDDGGLEPDGDRKKKKHKHDKYRREDRAEVRDKHKRRSRSPARHKGYGGSDDERGKAEEDRMHSHDDPQLSGVKQGLVYFTDRKGDLLNVRYGGLHAGDIPKHRLVDSEYSATTRSDN